MKLNLNSLLLLLMFVEVSYNLENTCTKDECAGDKTKSESQKYFYDETTNKILQNIQQAFAQYTPCVQHNNCSCFLPVIKQDLKPFRNGITKNMIDAARERGTKYQIIGHKLYRDKDCMFPARCSGIEYFIKPLLEKLPDMEMVINCRDWPQINPKWGMAELPVFSFSKTDEYSDIMYPAWSFHEGGPAISLYPTGLGKWEEHRQSITKAAQNWSWDKKLSKAFFRGSRTSSERDPLILLSRSNPEIVDAQYTKNQAWKSPADTLNAEPAKEVRFEDHCKYKYLFNYRGVAASFRFKHLFLCKSLVFHVGDEFIEFWYDSLKPWVHYVPVPSKATSDDIKDLIRFFKDNDDLAQKIAEEGFTHIWNNLRMKDVKCFWKKLLLKYGKLIKYEIEKDTSLIEIY